jgi:hypothetical protein
MVGLACFLCGETAEKREWVLWTLRCDYDEAGEFVRGPAPFCNECYLKWHEIFEKKFVERNGMTVAEALEES